MNAKTNEPDIAAYMGFANMGRDAVPAATPSDPAARAWAQLKNMAA